MKIKFVSLLLAIFMLSSISGMAAHENTVVSFCCPHPGFDKINVKQRHTFYVPRLDNNLDTFYLGKKTFTETIGYFDHNYLTEVGEFKFVAKEKGTTKIAIMGISFPV